MRKSKEKKSRNSKSTAMLAGLVLLVLVAIGVGLYAHRSTLIATSKSPSPTPAVTKGPAKIGTAAAGPGSTNATPVATPIVVANSSHPVTPLAKPVGPNDNTNTVSLSAATGMESTCQSVYGAQCHIQASLSGKTLVVSNTATIPASGTDGVILNWNANQLSKGTWTVQAVASYNGQTALSDPQTLTVD